MTPKEKAESLLRKMTVDFSIDLWQSKQCAIKAVEEILDYLKTSPDVLTSLDGVEYWQQVKQELEKI